MTLIRLAFGLAHNGAAEHRWRRVALPASALMFMILILVAASVFVMVDREGERDSARRALLSTNSASTDLLMVVRPDSWEDRTITVAWIEPVSPGAEPVLPPGVTTLPAPGQAVVSPGLDRLIEQHPDLATRYPDRGLLDPSGVRSGGELFAYVRMPADRHLAKEEAYRIQDGTIVGDGPAFRLGGFGSAEGGFGSLRVGDWVEVSTGAVLAGLLIVLVVPGIILLAIGCAAASELRDRRFELLRAIGAGARPVMTLAVLETLLLAFPGLVVATLVWGMVGGRIRTLPIVGYDVVAGDLGLPLWLLLTLLGAATALTAVVAVAVTAVVRRRQATPRPLPKPTEFSVLRVALLAGALAAFTYGRSYGGPSTETFYLVGVVCAVIGVTVFVPWVLSVAGKILSRLRPVMLSIVGRSMEWDPARAARPFVGAAALLVLVLSSAGYITLGRYSDEPRIPAGDAQAATVEWQDPQPGDVRRFRSAIGDGLTMPLAEGDHLHRHADGSGHHHGVGTGTLSIGVSCSEIAPYFPGASCDDTSPFQLSQAVQRQLAERLAPFAHGPVTEVRLVPSEELGGVGSLLFLDSATLEAIDARVRTAAMAVLPAPNIRSVQPTPKQESPLVRWIVGGALAAVIALTMACLLALVDRLLSARHHHRLLLNVGISTRRLTALAAWGFVLPYSVVLAASFVIGLVASAFLVLPVTTMPWRTVGTTAVVIVVVGVVGAIGLASLAAKDALREPE